MRPTEEDNRPIDQKQALRGATGSVFGFTGEDGIEQTHVDTASAQGRHAVEDVFGHAAIGKTKRGLREVAREMFPADVMVNPLHGSFEHDPHAFDPIRVDRSPAVFVGAMVDPGMLIALRFAVFIGSVVVREEKVALTDVLHNLWQEVHATGAVHGRGDGGGRSLPTWAWDCAL